MHKILETLGTIGIIPVITIEDEEQALPLGKALIAGGIPCAEITFRTPQAAGALARLRGELPELLLGAGTVLSPEQVDRALDAGAKFLVSPGFNPRVVARCLERGVPITPGCSSPSDMEAALEMGLEAVKVFPAEPLGGPAFIRAVSAPYPNLRFIPTGGINRGNIAAYLAHKSVLACGGSWMVPPEAIGAGDFGRITALCAEALGTILGFSLAHLGINGENEDEARRTAAFFALLLGAGERETGASIFAGEEIEVMKPPAPGERVPGEKGHIALGTRSVTRARGFLERRGFQFREDRETRDSQGALTAVYLKEEIAGFAIHLVQRT